MNKRVDICTFVWTFFVHLSDSKLVGKSRASLSIWCATSVVPAFCNFFFILTYRFSMVALTSYHWVRWHPSRIILRAVGCAIEHLSFPLSFPLTCLSSAEERRARDQRSVLSKRAGIYEGVTRYIEIGDVLVFFFFSLTCSSFLIREHRRLRLEKSNCAAGFNRLFLNGIVLSIVEFGRSLSLCITRIKISEKGDGILSDFRIIIHSVKLLHSTS